MSEKLEIYNMEWELISIEDRKDFYIEARKEFKNTWKITKKVKSVRILLLNSSWRIYLQKRSSSKTENPWMYEKSVWWHVSAWDSFTLTAIKECAEELGFPMTIVKNNEFDNAIKNTDLSIVWIFKKIDHIETFQSTRINKDWSYFVQPQITSIYIGYYDWPIRFVDWECSWIEIFSLNEVEEEIKNKPDKFTQDLKVMITKYKKYLTK